MSKSDFVITGMGVVSPLGVGKNSFWQALIDGRDGIEEIFSFDTSRFSVHKGAEIKNFDARSYLGQRGLRNLDRGTLFLLVSAKEAIEEAKIVVNESTTDDIGVSTGTNFSHLWPILEFDREVFTEGIEFASPGLFPSTVINAASSMVSIKFNIQGFNTTVTTGYTSGLSALDYGIDALSVGNAKEVLIGGVDSLTFSLFFGFHKLGYMAGIKGEALMCPFDKRRNGPLLGEGAGVLSVESEESAKKRGVMPLAYIKSVASYFDAYKIGKVHPQGLGLEKAIREAFDKAGMSISNIDYIASCANSSFDVDAIEVKVLKKIFGKRTRQIPASSIKSMLGEAFSASGIFQIIASVLAMHNGILPPTINYKVPDSFCDIDCVPNKAQKKDVCSVLVTSFGPGGYNSACILEKAPFPTA